MKSNQCEGFISCAGGGYFIRWSRSKLCQFRHVCNTPAVDFVPTFK